MVNATPRELNPVPIVQEAGWTSGAVRTGVENLAATGIRSRTVHPVASYPGQLNDIMEQCSEQSEYP